MSELKPAIAPSTPTPREANAPEAWYAYAFSLQRENKMVEASEAYLTLIKQAPTHWPSFYNLGIVFQSLNRLADACTAYQRVVAINPGFAQAYNNMGIVLQALKRDDEAFIAYERAIALSPGLAQARYNLALIQQARGQITASSDSLRTAVAANPTDNNAWEALYRALLAMRRQEEAVQTFLQWEAAIKQSSALTAAGLAMSRYLGDEDKAQEYIKLAVDWPFDDAPPGAIAHILGLLQYFDIVGDDLLKCYQRYNQAMKKTGVADVAMLPRRSKGDKLRIGYVSADFRRHVMGRIMLDVLSAHDRDRFAIHLISLCDPRFHDQTTTAFKNIAEAFVDVSKLSDSEAAKVVAQLDLDVLVDLAGHMMAARPAIYAQRPAQKIVSHLGYHGCLGLEAVDYKFTDAIADDAASTKYQIEKPYFLDGCLLPLTHVASSAEAIAQYLRDDADTAFVFATFVNVLKMSPRCLNAWQKILQAVPNAVLAFSPVYADDETSIRRATRIAGIDDTRLRFIPAGKTDGEMRARYQLVDAVLDTFPYAGGDTTLAALDRNVPVITLNGNRQGARNAERVGASILTHLGVPDTICDSEADYVACAIRIANDRAWYQSLRERIATARQHAVIADPPKHAQLLERAYVEIAAENTERINATLTAAEFFTQFNAAIKAHETLQVATKQADNAKNFDALNQAYAALDLEQPDYLPLLKLWAQLVHTHGPIKNAAVGSADANMDSASTLLKRILAVAPADSQATLLLASIQSSAGDNDAALSSVDACLITIKTSVESINAQPDTNSMALLTAKARLLMRLDRAEDALLAANAAVAIAPADTQANLMRANALAELGDSHQALFAYSCVLSQTPTHVDAAYNAGLMSLDGGDFAAAETLFRRVITIDSKHEGSHIKLAHTLKMQRKTEAWISLAKRVAAKFPVSARGKLLRAEARRYEQDLAGETRDISMLATALCSEPDHLLVEDLAQPILNRAMAIGLTEPTVAALAERYLVALASIYAPLNDIFATDKAQSELPTRLKIGFLLDDDPSVPSARQQLAVMFANSFAKSEVGASDSAAASIIFYTLTAPREPALVVSVDVPMSAAVISLSGLSATRAARRIRESSPDVLIDLVGYRHALAPAIMIQKPAKMQLVNGAFANIFDCEAIDFEIFDLWTALPSWQVRGPSRPVMRLPAVTALLVANSPSATRYRANSADVVFAICAPAEDISMRAMRLWKAILDKLPQALIGVPANSDTELRAFHEVLRAGGIGSTRIRPLAHDTDAVSRFETATAVLDTPAASDAIVAAEAIAAGVPMIALRGPTAPERMAYSVLARSNLSEMVADSEPDYVALAIKFAEDKAFGEMIYAKLAVANLSAITGVRQHDNAQSSYEALQFAFKEVSQGVRQHIPQDVSQGLSRLAAPHKIS